MLLYFSSVLLVSMPVPPVAHANCSIIISKPLARSHYPFTTLKFAARCLFPTTETKHLLFWISLARHWRQSRQVSKSTFPMLPFGQLTSRVSHCSRLCPIADLKFQACPTHTNSPNRCLWPCGVLSRGYSGTHRLSSSSGPSLGAPRRSGPSSWASKA